MKSLELHTGAPTVHWEDNTSYISYIEAKKVTPRVKHINIPVFFYRNSLTNGLFVSKYDNYSVMPVDMYTKTCAGPIISRSTKWITGFRLYPTSDIEHYQLIK